MHMHLCPFYQTPTDAHVLLQVRGVLLDPSCSGSGTTFTRMDHLLPSYAARTKWPAGQAFVQTGNAAASKASTAAAADAVEGVPEGPADAEDAARVAQLAKFQVRCLPMEPSCRFTFLCCCLFGLFHTLAHCIKRGRFVCTRQAGPEGTRMRAYKWASPLCHYPSR